MSDHSGEVCFDLDHVPMEHMDIKLQKQLDQVLIFADPSKEKDKSLLSDLKNFLGPYFSSLFSSVSSLIL